MKTKDPYIFSNKEVVINDLQRKEVKATHASPFNYYVYVRNNDEGIDCKLKANNIEEAKNKFFDLLYIDNT
jgi:hypothetical protein